MEKKGLKAFVFFVLVLGIFVISFSEIKSAPPGGEESNCVDGDGDLWTTSNPGFCNGYCGSLGFLCEGFGDCDDGDPKEHPGQKWYKDIDGDGYSDGENIIQCLRPTGYKTSVELDYHTSGDCDDSSSGINPGEEEICDQLDNDCNGIVDDTEGACGTQCDDIQDKCPLDSDKGLYIDYYENYYGECMQESERCSLSKECQISTKGCFNPILTCILEDSVWTWTSVPGEYCSLPLSTYYRDADGDGYGDPNNYVQSKSNPPPIGWYVPNKLDCDDGSNIVHPGAEEVCGDNQDNDCNGFRDCADSSCWTNALCECKDLDGDGYNRTNEYVECGLVDCDDEIRDDPIGCCPASPGECTADDARCAICQNPEMEEICANGVDDDCIGGDQFGDCTCLDEDGDGFNASGFGCGITDCDDRPDGADGIPNNADDGENRFPGNVEIPNNHVDEDCDLQDERVCTFTSASWDETSLAESLPAIMTLQGDDHYGCNGQTVNFSIFEQDVSPPYDYPDQNSLLISFIGDEAVGTWITEWLNDGDGTDPEFNFSGTQIDDPSEVEYSSNLLTVIPCIPECTDSEGRAYECGSDGCGGSCGTCPAAKTCQNETWTCVDENDGVCDLTFASWGIEEGPVGSTGPMIIMGDQDCAAVGIKEFNFTIQEYDSEDTDAVEISERSNSGLWFPLDANTFLSVGRWTVEWQSDDDGDGDPPEYIFTAESVSNPLISIESGTGSSESYSTVKLLMALPEICQDVTQPSDYNNLGETACEENVCNLDLLAFDDRCDQGMGNQCPGNTWIDNCRFQWSVDANNDGGVCQFAKDILPCDGSSFPTTGTCTYNPGETALTCSDIPLGYYISSWSGIFTPGHEGSETKSECEGLYGAGNCANLSRTGLWYYDPEGEIADCEAGESTMFECPASVELPFFGFWQIITSILAITGIYFFMRRKE